MVSFAGLAVAEALTPGERERKRRGGARATFPRKLTLSAEKGVTRQKESGQEKKKEKIREIGKAMPSVL